MSAPTASDSWHVAALTMMRPEVLCETLTGKDAARWIEAAANLGLVDAQLRLGRMLLTGEGVRDAGRAFALFCDAAAQGSADGENMLGRCYENGWGVAVDFALAARWYRRAAAQGLDWAQYNLGHLLLDGNGVVRDRGEAFRWYSRAAGQGHPRAMNLLARCYEEGWGVAPDQQRARAWYRRSAEGGYFRGAYNYGTVLAQEACAAGARYWLSRAIATAPEPTRSAMRRALSRGPKTPGRQRMTSK